MRYLALLFLFPMLLLAAAVNAAAAGIATGIPSSAADDPKQLQDAVMKEFYGSYDQSRKCWVSEFKGKRQCKNLHRLDTVSGNDATRFFIVVGGYEINDKGGRSDCHVCPGSLGLIVLEKGTETLRLVARNSLTEPVGTWGKVPDKDMFRLREIGPDRYGWTMGHLWMGQGYTLSSFTVYGISGSDVIELGDIPVHTDNSGTCGNGMGECYDKSYDLVFDALSGNRYYEIVLRRRIESTGGAENYHITFDGKMMTYRVPDAVKATLGK